MRLALTRGVSPALAQCELTFVAREPIDHGRALAQHRAYGRLLEGLGLTVVEIPGEAALPDCCFIEDVAIVLDEAAVLTRPGAPSRRGETAAVAAALAAYRPLRRLEAPARLDGGDVLVVDRRLLVGVSSRTDAAGLRALEDAVNPLGYAVEAVPLRGCLHLKSAVTLAAPGLALLNPDWVEPAALPGLDTIAVAPEEPDAANVLLVGSAVVAAAGFPRTADRLRARGLDVREVDISEFRKAEGGVTCKSLVFDVAEDRTAE
jgi:dimethylargininase